MPELWTAVNVSRGRLTQDDVGEVTTIQVFLSHLKILDFVLKFDGKLLKDLN